MTPTTLGPVANHLWQSTLFAAAAGILTLALRKNRAQVRYVVWLAASVKFLVPFSVLLKFGGTLGWLPGAGARTQARVSFLADQVSQPFAPAGRLTQWAAASPAAWNPLPAVLLGLWGFGVAVVAFRWWLRWWRLREVIRTATPLSRDAQGMRAVSSRSLVEPGVFGILRPVLVLPEGITERLTPAQFEAIVAHELCHVRRRDNLAAALHMAVEVLFWFYPLVWWMERQLVKERERACDEEVLRQGNDPEVYAEGILKVCQYYVESGLVCAAGVTGADLKKRIEEIMTNQARRQLDLGKKLLLGTAALAAVMAPVLVGMMQGIPLRAQSPSGGHPAFEVASIKENKAHDPRSRGMQFLPGGRLVVRDLPLIVLISAAYDLPPFATDRLTGGPDWIRNTQYDIDATAEKGAIPEGASQTVQNERMQLMLQTLLAERFQLTVRRETKELPVYWIAVAKGGPKLPKAAVEEKNCSKDPTGPNDPAGCHAFSGGQGRGLHGQVVSLADLTKAVERFADRPVIDRSGLKGLYNVQTEGWVPMRPRPPGAPGQEPSAEDKAFADPTRPTIFQILDRLGLKLEPQKGTVETIEIVSARKPSEN